MGLHEEAIEILRTALDVARFAANEEARFLRQIHEISSKHLAGPARAAPDLARYLERHSDGEHAEWARQELSYIKERIREDH
jgi:hypothetical protein